MRTWTYLSGHHFSPLHTLLVVFPATRQLPVLPFPMWADVRSGKGYFSVRVTNDPQDFTTWTFEDVSCFYS